MRVIWLVVDVLVLVGGLPTWPSFVMLLCAGFTIGHLDASLLDINNPLLSSISSSA